MEGFLKIEDEKFIYQCDENKHKHAYYKSKSFEVNLNMISLIGVYHIFILDDEIDILVIVDLLENKNYIPITYDMDANSFQLFLDHFKLTNNFVCADEKEYEKGNSYVIYPPNLKGKKLYKKKSLFISIKHFFLKVFHFKYVADGFLTNELKRYIINKKTEII